MQIVFNLQLSESMLALGLGYVCSCYVLMLALGYMYLILFKQWIKLVHEIIKAYCSYLTLKTHTNILLIFHALLIRGQNWKKAWIL